MRCGHFLALCHLHKDSFWCRPVLGDQRHYGDPPMAIAQVIENIAQTIVAVHDGDGVFTAELRPLVPASITPAVLAALWRSRA